MNPRALLGRLRRVREAIGPPPTHFRHVFEETDRDDVYLVSYPRSGSTWLRCLLTTLLSGHPITPGLMEAFVPDVYKCHQAGIPKPKIRPLVIKTHAPYLALSAKVIYLVRDGREVLSSYYRYAQRIPPPSIYDGFQRLQDFYFRDDLWPSPWHKHVEGWLNGTSAWPRDQYLLVKYEDLFQSTAGVLGSIARFIGIEAAEDELARAVGLNSRESMRSIEKSSGKGSLNFIARRRIDDEVALSEEEAARYEAVAGEALKRLGYTSSG